MCDLTRQQKHNIRKRDAKRIKLTGRCVLCGCTTQPTSRHHLFYIKEHYTPSAVIEVCDTCDDLIHERNDNDQWVKTLKSVRQIELVKDRKDPEEYTINVEGQNVGCARPTSTGLKLVIVD